MSYTTQPMDPEELHRKRVRDMLFNIQAAAIASAVLLAVACVLLWMVYSEVKG